MEQRQTGNTMCLEDSVADIAQAVKANGNGGSLKDIADAIREGNNGSGVTAVQLKSFPDEDYGIRFPYPLDEPIFTILGNKDGMGEKDGEGDVKLRMENCPNAAYFCSGNPGDCVDWKKGEFSKWPIYVYGYNNFLILNVGIFDASYKILRQIDLLLYFTGGEYVPDAGANAPRFLKRCIAREYKTANL